MEITTKPDTKNALFNIKLNMEVLFWLVFLISMMVKCFYFQFTTQLNRVPYFCSENNCMLVSTFGVLLFITGLVYAFFNRKRIIALLVINFVLSALLIADTNCFRYYNATISVPVILNADIRLLGSVKQSIMSLFKLKDLIYILDIPFFVMGVISVQKSRIKKIPFQRRLVPALIVTILGYMVFTTVYKESEIQDELAYNKNYITKSMGVFYSHSRSVKNYISNSLFGKNKLTDKEIEQIQNFFNDKDNEKHKNFNGIAKGSNLIVVQVEALQQFVINRKICGEEITPNLNSLLKESLYFDNFYYQTAGGNTSDAEFLCNTSLYPVREGAVYMRYPQNDYFSLPKLLKQYGYNTYVMHGFKPEFYNRQEMYKAIGFDRFFSEIDYELDDFVGWEGNVLSDASFFRQSLDKINKDKPFYAFLITLSSHHPFKYFEDFEFNVGEFEGTYLGNYMKAINYADKCIGQFIKQLKEEGLYDNTLLVMYGDHLAVPRYLSDQLMKLTGKEYSDFEWEKLQKVPCIIHYPGLDQGEVISKTGGQIDLFPIISNLLGIQFPYVLGKDLLNTEKGYVVLRNGSVITDEYIYLNDTREFYNICNGSNVNKKEYSEELDRLLKQLYISDLIVEKNAFQEMKLPQNYAYSQ